MTTEDEAITRLFSDYRGDDWHLHFTAPQVDGVVWDQDTLLWQIRSTDGTLIASTGTDGAGDGVIQLVTTGTDLEADPMVLKVSTSGSTSAVDPNGSYVIEGQCEINGFVDTFLHHPWAVAADYAYQEA